jgi:serine/threonine protein phosphatase PrpC
VIGRVASVTDTGRKRRRNEDAYVSEPPLFAIADGMGGAQAGEVASQLAAAAVSEGGAADGRGEERIFQLIQEANRRVYDRASTDPHTSGMGTTMTVAIVDGDQVAFGHVGDSRAYLIRDGEMQQLTEDHSLVNELMKSGKLSREEADIHPQRSVITRAVGTDPDVDVDTFTVDAETGDLFLLCSDGLTDVVSEEEILDLVERNRGDIDRALKALVKEANRGGGEDNITVVAFEIADEAVRDGQTKEQALPPELAQAPAADDEDTLTEADNVPAVKPPVRDSGPVEGVWGNREAPPARANASDTMIVSAEELRAASADEAPPPRRHLRRRLAAWLVLLLFIAAVAALVLWKLDLFG